MKKITKILLAALMIPVLFSGCSSGSSSSKDNDPVLTPDDTSDGGQSVNLEKYWYKNTSFYHIWVKSFATGEKTKTSNKSGTLQGIKANLDYIKNEVGCDGIWLSPIFDCAGKSNSDSENMHGYDTTDFENVNSYFGTNSDLADLISACHTKGMKIIFDFVPNHTSDQHNWFKQSCSASENDYYDWYVWDDTGNALNPCGVSGDNAAGGAWFYNSTRKKYYYGAFGRGMPDLNYNNEDVQNYMLNIVKKWMDFGFDGIRVDACQYLVETSTEASSTEGTHNFFKKVRKILDSYTSPKFMVGETWIENNRTRLDGYFGSSTDPEYNMVFDFDAGRPLLSSVQSSKDQTGSTLRKNPVDFEGECYGVFLANHDVYEDRLGTEFNGDEFGIMEATALTYLRPNVPFIYYGQEIGQAAPNGGFKLTSYSDMEMRAPLDWTTVKTQASSSNSILKLNKALNDLRKAYPNTFAGGEIEKFSAAGGNVLAYKISGTDGNILCVFNLSGTAIASKNVNPNEKVTSFSTLIGSSDVTFSGSTATVTNLAPYAFRAYLLNKEDGKLYFNNENYSAGDHEIDYEVKVYYDSMYLTGSMNSWGGDAMTSTDNGLTWSVTKSLNKGSYSFKFRPTTANWDKSWGSYYGSITFTPSVSLPVTNKDDNITLNIDTTGNYTFYFDTVKGYATITDSSTTEQQAKEKSIYLRGSFSSWDDYKGIPLSTTDGITYSVTFTPEAGSYDFKICRNQNNWTENWGSPTSASTKLTLGTESATGTGGNLVVTVTKVPMTITLNTSTGKIVVSQ